MILVFSTSLHPDSRSRIMAGMAAAHLTEQQVDCELVDLAGLDLPACNGHDCYSHPVVGNLSEKIAGAAGILMAVPIYNFDVSATAKNLVELTGSAWNDKVVGFVCSAGGQGSYMAPMSFAGSLMLDFRCLVLPRYVFADEAAFDDGQIVDSSIGTRIAHLVDQLVQVSGVYTGQPR